MLGMSYRHGGGVIESIEVKGFKTLHDVTIPLAGGNHRSRRREQQRQIQFDVAPVLGRRDGADR